MNLETDNGRVILPSPRYCRLPVRFLRLFSRALEQAQRDGSYTRETDGFHISAVRHLNGSLNDCHGCETAETPLLKVSWASDTGSRWRSEQQRCFYCASCANALIKTTEQELDTNPEKYLGHAL